MTHELATRVLLAQPEPEEELHEEEPLTAQEDAVVDSVVAVLKEHPEIVEKLGGPEGLGDVIADELAAARDNGPEPPAAAPGTRTPILPILPDAVRGREDVSSVKSDL